ncbi:DUF1761 domain-containing protein [Candidatus Parcubacteria bacterium]|nr:DUF1761 domain-containing protein [Candidatus Parcubacteria bacterium]
MGINYLAVLVATVGAYAVGALWYSLLFRRPWMRLMGINADHVGGMPASRAMILGFISTLVMVYVLSVFVSAAPDLGGALIISFWIWLGFTATVQIGSYLWEGKPIKLFLINASQSLVAMLVATIILSLWR